MAFFEYGVGGNEVKTDTSDSISNIPFNKTMFVEQLTSEEPVNPETITGLKTVADVFSHFQPNIDIEFEDGDGLPVRENFRFGSVADFKANNLTDNSNFLKDLSDQKDFYNKVIKQLRSNRILQKALQDAGSKAAFVEVLQLLVAELEEHEVTESNE